MILRNKNVSGLLARRLWSGIGGSLALCLDTSFRGVFSEEPCSIPTEEACSQSVPAVSGGASSNTCDDALSHTGCSSQQPHHVKGASDVVPPFLQCDSWQPFRQHAAATTLASSPLYATGLHWTAAAALGTWSVSGLAQRLGAHHGEAAQQRRSLQSCSQQTRVSEANALMQVRLQHTRPRVGACTST